MTSTFKSNCKTTKTHTFQPENIIDIANASRTERMQYLLDKIEGFLSENKIIQDTKLLRREKRRLSCIENYNPNVKISYFNHEEKGFLYSPVRCFQDSEERKKYLYGSIVDQKIKIPSGNEFNEIIEFIENELKISDIMPEIKVVNSSEHLMSEKNEAIIINEDIKSFKFEKVEEEDKDKICIDNIKNHIFDLEYKLKVELKKIEYLEQAEIKRQINMDEVTGNDKAFMSNFSNLTLEGKSISNFSSQKRENPFIDFIKEFYVDNKTVGVAKPKRFSIIDELKMENFFDKDENSELEIKEEFNNEDQSKEINKNEKPKKKRQSRLLAVYFSLNLYL